MRSLFTTIVTRLLLVALVPTVIGSGVFMYQAQETHESTVAEILSVKANAVVREFEDGIGALVHEITIYTDILAAGLDEDRIYLKRIFYGNARFNEIRIVDDNGVTRFGISKYHYIPEGQVVDVGKNAGTLVREDNDILYTGQVPVDYFNGERGWLCFEVSMREMLDTLAMTSRRDAYQYFIVDTIGDLLYHSDYDLVLVGYAYPMDRLVRSVPGVTYMRHHPVSGDMQQYTGILLDVSGMPFTAGVEIPVAEAYDYLADQRAQFLLLLLLLVAASFFASYFLSLRMTRPIAGLSVATSRVADGDFSLVLDDYPDNEIGHLAENFQHMIDRVRELVADKDAAFSEIRDLYEQVEGHAVKMRLLFNSILDGIFVVGTDGRVTMINDKELEYLGRTRDEVIGKRCHEVFEDACLCPECLSDTDTDMPKLPFYRYDVELATELRPNDPREFVNVSYYPYSDSEIIVTVQDITSRKRMERAMVRSEEMFRSISSSAQDAIIMVDTGSVISYWNPAAERIFGYGPTEALGHSMIELLSPDMEREKVYFEKFRTLWSGQNRSDVGIQAEVKAKDGRILPVEISVSQLRLFGQGQAVLIIRDISGRKRMERELKDLNRDLELRVRLEVEERSRQEQLLIQQSRFAALGEMLGAIAHQWRQPLNALALNVQDLADAFEYDELDREYITDSNERAMELIMFMSRTIDDFRNFFQAKKVKERFNVFTLINQVLSLLEPQFRNNRISFTVDASCGNVPCGESEVLGYPSEFKQVILNILNNARDAILEYREQTSTTDDILGEIRVFVDPRGDEINISITDNGGGIKDESLVRLFDPYYTTKEQGKGTGIGLYMSKTIIENSMGGEIRAENAESGARFIITLPVGGSEDDAVENEERQDA